MRHDSPSESHLTLYSYADGKYSEAGCYLAHWLPPKDGEIQDPEIKPCTSDASKTDEAKPAEPPATEAKPAEPKPDEAKPTEPLQNQPATDESKPSPPAPEEPKPAEPDQPKSDQAKPN